MRNLQNRWYDFLVETLSLDPALFQIWLPGAPLDASDAALWDCQDVIPPDSLIFDRTSCQVARLSDQYAGVADQMARSTASLAEQIGDTHARAWAAYLGTLEAPPPRTEMALLFRDWAARHATGAMSVGVGLFTRAALAETSPSSPGKIAKPASFVGGHSDLMHLLAASSGAAGSFDSRRVAAAAHANWTAINGGIAGLWSGSDDAPLHRRFAESAVTARVAFGARAAWVVVPGPWYHSSVLATAYASSASPPWLPDANPGWQHSFGTGGSMRRAPASLLVVDAVDIRIASDACFDRADQQAIRQHATRGLWPLYAPPSDIVDMKIDFDGDGRLSFRTTTLARHPLVMGANVLAMAQYLGRAA